MADFSIIVPIYNVEAYLRECLDSIAAQTHRDFEVLCVVDGSTDGSCAIAREFAERDSRFQVLEKENGGLSSARNFGVAHATGDFVMFVDADDRIRLECCSRLLRAFSESRGDVVVFGARVFPDEANTPWYDMVLSPEDALFDEFSPDFMFAPYTTPFAWRCAVRRRALVASGVTFDEGLAFGEDVIFQFALYPRAGRLVSISEKLYEYRLGREGSLMGQLSDDVQRLEMHTEEVRRVFADWEGLGLLERYPRELFDWSRDYLLFGVENLPDAERDAQYKRANELWSRYFGTIEVPDSSGESVHPLEVNSDCVCRGDGKLYAACTVRAFTPFRSLKAAAHVGDASVPVGVYPRTAGQGGCEQEWVVEAPLMASEGILVELIPDGREFERVVVSVNYWLVKWQSRLNYRLYADECAAIRDFERLFPDGRYQVSVDLRFPDGTKAVWRATVKWRGDSKTQPDLSVRDGAGERLDAVMHVLEEQARPLPDGTVENMLTISVVLPVWCAHFLVCAESPEGAIEPGFAVVDPDSASSAEAHVAALMKHAGQDDDAYRLWLDAHRATPDELEAQRGQVLANPPRFTCIVVADDAGAKDLEKTLDSIRAQTYPLWYACVVGTSSLKSAQTGRYLEGPMTVSFASTVMEAIGRAHDGYVVFAEAEDVFEPDALFEYARAAEDGEAEVLYCDEDAIGEYDMCGRPLFKSQLNLDLLYCGNWVGNALAVRTDVLAAAFSGREAEGFRSHAAMLYECALRAYEAKARFRYVDRMLFHAHAAPFPGDDLASLVPVLEAHLARRGIGAKVQARKDGTGLRVEYALPDPQPLVSIVIPSKDQADLLETCVRSIVEKATYDAYEIVVVENNSVEGDTLARYSQLEAELEPVRIVRWPGEFNYSKIVNFGAEQARGDYLLFLNNDTRVIAPGFIEEMLGFLQRPEVGVVGAKLLFEDGLVQHAGMEVGVFGAVVHANQNRPADEGGYLNRACLPGNFSSVTGACQMVRRATFDEVGGYDERFAVGFNDVDFCLRAQRAGLFVTFAPDAVLYHREFASRGREVEGAKLMRWRRERALFMETWPEPFVYGDAYTSPNLKRENTYYALGEAEVREETGSGGALQLTRKTVVQRAQEALARPLDMVKQLGLGGRSVDTSGNGPGYHDWFLRHRATPKELDEQRGVRFALQPKFSIIVPLYDTPIDYLREMADSVIGQTYGNLELVLVIASPEDDELREACTLLARLDARVIVREVPCNLGITLNTNVGIRAATGDFLCFVDHDDIIEPNALFEYAKAVNECPDVDMLYCDEDKLLDGRFVGGFFKPDYDRTLIRSVNFVTHMLAVRTSLVLGLGELPGPEFDGAQDHNLTMLAAERARAIRHVPEVLYHWRIHEGSTADDEGAKTYAALSGRYAVEQHLQRIGEKAYVELGADFAFTFKVTYPQSARVSVVKVPKVGAVEEVAATTALVLPDAAASRVSDDASRVAAVNAAVEQADCGLVAIVADGVEPCSPQWIDLVAGHACRPGVVACGPKVLYADDLVRSLGVVVSGGVPVRLDEGAERHQRHMHVLTRFAREVTALDPDCFVVQRDAFLRAGGLDESLPYELAVLNLFLTLGEVGAVVVEPLAEVRVSFKRGEGGAALTDDTLALVRVVKRHPKCFATPDPHYSPRYAACSADFKLE